MKSPKAPQSQRVRIVQWESPSGPGSAFWISKRMEGRDYQCRIGPSDRMTFFELAELLGVAVLTIHRWRDSGKLKTIKPKRGPHQVPFKEVKRLLAERGIDRYDAPKAELKELFDSLDGTEQLSNERRSRGRSDRAAGKRSYTVSIDQLKELGFTEFVISSPDDPLKVVKRLQRTKKDGNKGKTGARSRGSRKGSR